MFLLTGNSSTNNSCRHMLRCFNTYFWYGWYCFSCVVLKECWIIVTCIIGHCYLKKVVKLSVWDKKMIVTSQNMPKKLKKKTKKYQVCSYNYEMNMCWTYIIMNWTCGGFIKYTSLMFQIIWSMHNAFWYRKKYITSFT